MQMKTNYNYKKGIEELKKASMFFPNGSGIYKFIGVYNEPCMLAKPKILKKNFFIP